MMKSIENCIGCNSDDYVELYEFGESKYVRCTQCKLISVHPLPTDDHLKERAEHWSLQYHTNSLKIQQHYSKEFQLAAYSNILNLIRPYKKNRRLLDLGCSIGGFLMAAKNDGWIEYGIDVSPSVNVAIGKGLNARQGFLRDFNFPFEFFDVITMFDVIEHIGNQEELFEQLFSLLRPGGIVFIITPNFEGISSRLLKKNWSAVTPEDHVYLFTAQSLANIIKNKGFKVVKVFTFDINITEYKNSFRSRSKVDEGRLIGQMNRRRLIQRIVDSNLLQGIRNVANSVINLLKIGDRLIVICKRNDPNAS